jgi:glycosyltransferase involved in cell wall biosynthesis
MNETLGKEPLPLVTVVCISYNHERFLKEAVDSISQQTYPAIEVILMDDASQDNSAAMLHSLAKKLPFPSKIIIHKANEGLCKTFNEALYLATGKYVIDHAADDIMLPQRVEEQVKRLEGVGNHAAICYSDAIIVNEKGTPKGLYSDIQRVNKFWEGDVFQKLFGHPFICPPTVMFRTELLKQAGGYNQNLSYEDFDIWMRLARLHSFTCVNAPLVKYRKVSSSMSNAKFRKKEHLRSTSLIIEKAKELVKNKEELRALYEWSAYQLRFALYNSCFEEAKMIDKQMKNMETFSFKGIIAGLLARVLG